MGRSLGAENRKKHDSWWFMMAFVKRARRNRKCCKCHRIASRAILGPSAKYPLTTLRQMSTSTLAILKQAIRDTGWWCRSCQSTEGKMDKKEAEKKKYGAWGKRPGLDF